jgi:preprotein translocase subunit YajC
MEITLTKTLIVLIGFMPLLVPIIYFLVQMRNRKRQKKINDEWMKGFRHELNSLK